ncbi:acetate/propionate family kinase [Mesorhizobium sp. IMUNJ 23232]|uniref:acetate/propionate family kinase n=1 Tax=Mesorhizobium sp. IMUNJ 23232 TaxID=3376064 RepID=UPI0037B2D458
MDAILVVNAGSSSLKFQIFEIIDGKPEGRIRGQLDGIGVRPRLRATSDGRVLVERTYQPAEVADLPTAVGKAREWLASLDGIALRAIGHRVVHGGPDYDRPILIDAMVLDRLVEYQNLAPLHQPNNLAPIRLVMDIDPSIPQVACFDTAFHRGRPETADCYALPRSLYQQGVRRYGFHGLSYEYIAERLAEIAPTKDKVIVAHLGSGASMCALGDGRSVESTMGFTALDGVPMGTRPGQLDPGVVLYLLQKGMSQQAISDLLYRESGLKGLSGISNDVRDLLASTDPGAKFAIDHFIHRCGLNAGLLAAALGGIDGFVFTAGIGENSSAIRALLAEKLAWLGAELDHAANEAGATVVSTATSRIKLLIIPTNEELMIARHTLAIVGNP